jgi:hypothetical protein
MLVDTEQLIFPQVLDELERGESDQAHDLALA